MRINKELMKGSTAILILTLLEKEDMYGYSITSELKKKTENMLDLKEGTLYPMLHGLEEANAVDSYWRDSENGKKRKYYKITEEGKEILFEKLQEWGAYTRAVNSVLRTTIC